MGSNETATTTTGAPRVIAVFYGNGRHRVQIIYFFRMQIGSWSPLGVGMVVGSRLCRMRRFLGPSESSGSHCQVIHGFVGRSAERIGRNMLEAAACAV